MKLAIIGGGASGLFAGVTAADTGHFESIVIYEKLDRVGKKLLVTGNGRCNLMNTGLDPTRYHSEHPAAAMGILESFPPKEQIRAFEAMGLLCRAEEGGRVYPYSAQASSVLDVLRFRALELGTRIRENAEISGIQRTPGGFRLRSGDEILEADRVILACGGSAAPKLGSDGSGHRLLRSLGHSISPVTPALVQLKTETSWTRQLKGIKLEMEASLHAENQLQNRQRGDVLFTEYGLSGTAILDLSRAAARLKNCEIMLDAMPEYDTRQIIRLLQSRAEAFRGRALFDFFTGLLNKRYGQVLLKSLGYVLSDPAATLTPPGLARIADAIKGFRIPVTGTTGFPGAQVTAGGALLSEFDPHTLESKKVPGLFACGEVLDVDGDCGGYNLTWCWASARAAALGAADH